jgi:hypothetical protein
MTFLVAMRGRREERGPAGLPLLVVVFARLVVLVGGSRNLCV